MIRLSKLPPGFWKQNFICPFLQ